MAGEHPEGTVVCNTMLIFSKTTLHEFSRTVFEISFTGHLQTSLLLS